MSFTLITICWNSAKTIERCVNSILAQTRLPDEYIFVDGGSTDGTLEKLQEFCAILEKQNVRTLIWPQIRKDGEAGIPSAWNQAITRAKGDIIALLNSDDWYEPQTIEYVSKRFEKTPDLEILSGPVQMRAPDGVPTKVLRPQCLCLSQILMPLKHPACFIAKKLYARTGLYDTHYKISSDYEFVLRCKRCQASIEYFDECLVNMEAGGLANSNRSIARNETVRIARLYYPFSPLPYIAWLLRFLSGR